MWQAGDPCAHGRKMMRLGIAKSVKSVIMDNGSKREGRCHRNMTEPVRWGWRQNILIGKKENGSNDKMEKHGKKTS